MIQKEINLSTNSKKQSNLTYQVSGIFFLIFIGFSIFYHVVLTINTNPKERSLVDGIFNFSNFWYQSGFAYFLFYICFILIIGLSELISNQIFKIGIVFILTFLSSYFLRELRYLFYDTWEVGRLTGSGTIWDLYIPILFLMIQFSIFFAYTYFKTVKHNMIVQSELREATLKSELIAIKAQLNPHFLYNIFNTISASLPPENEKTREMIAELSELFRYQLKASKEDFVTIGEELEFVMNYLKLEKARFEERLQIETDINPSLLSAKIPPMLLQPLVENAIKHGISPKIEGGTVKIRIFKSGEKIAFEIIDTGVGWKEKDINKEVGFGLANTRKRLEKMYGSQIVIEDNIPNGLIVKFKI